MATPRQTRNWISAVVVVLIVVDLAMALYLFSPLRDRPWKKQQELESAKANLELKKKEATPLMGMDQKLVRTQADLDAFYRNRFPAKNSAIVAELGKLANQAGVRISAVKYEEKEAGNGLTHMQIEAGLDGEYLNAVKFINALERNKMFFILNGVALGEQQGGSVRLDLKLETYLRS